MRHAGTGLVDGWNYFQVGGVAVLGVASMSLGDGAVFHGYGSRPYVIVSAGDVAVHGIVSANASVCADVAQRAQCGGPGGGAGGTGKSAATGCGPGTNGSAANPETGGGGGGFGTDGKKGGDSDAAAGGPAGTSSQCGAATLVPLRGGSGGGLGGNGGSGGGGGGGVQVTSFTRIAMSKVTSIVGVWATGWGGLHGGAQGGGGGGGSGGAILLEAPAIVLDGNVVLAANGGGGGQGNGAGDGMYGLFDVAAAPGGDDLTGAGFPGGAGGFGTTPPVVGADGGGTRGSGGGGGAVGRIRINADSVTDAGARVTPTASTGPFPVQ